jgi:Phage tail sheath C-terminal domain
MAEAIAEMVLPGTYIEVRAEGLISAGAISTGNIGIVGTAARGPRNEVRAIGSYAEALDMFGAYDAFGSPTVADHPLTLTRALERAFGGGARNVFAVRVANGDPVAASAAVKAAGNKAGFTITAADEGSYGNDIAYTVVNEGTAAAPNWKLTLTFGPTKESFSGATVGDVHDALATSSLVTVGNVSNAGLDFDTVDPAQKLAGGDDQPNVSSVDLAAGLAQLLDDPVNILLVAGVGSDVARGVVAAHLEQAENEGHERIAVLGAPVSGTKSDASDVLDEASALNDDRIVLVAPGLLATDARTGKEVALPPPYLAATIAGMLSTLAPQVSLTNKTVPIDGLDVAYSAPVYQNLLQNRVLLVRKKLGFQVVKGITTDAGPFKQISVRRIVDYAKAGVRSGADPYIGRLNNARVRAALKATLDGFLSQMVLDEMLVGYDLEVTATRAEEIQGICRVTMTLLPTFSIDFIRVTMNLQ